jgi:predicted phosphodiesterase
MKFSIVSDLHFDRHRDKGISFVDSLQTDGLDGIIIAGDMGEQKDIDLPLGLFCKKFKRVIRVNGNHEFYGSSKEEVEANEEKRKKKYKNYHLLNNEMLEIEGKRFLGTTLWFNYVPLEITKDWSDFHYIKKFGDWVFYENRAARKFLEKNTRKGDIIITHYLPSEISINEKFKNNPWNCFFVCDMEWLIEDRKPAVWIHGHTHCALDKQLEETRIICNPLGYIGYEGNTGFIENLILEI